MPEKHSSEPMTLNETATYRPLESGNSDYSAVEDGLSMTPWERILANDDVINFGESLRAAMEKHNAKSR